MKVKKEKVERLIERLDELAALVLEAEERHADQINAVDPGMRKSATNLVHFRALRTRDLSAVQTALGSLGVSRLAQSHGHVMASLDSARHLLRKLIDAEIPDSPKPPISIRKSHKMLRTHTKGLLGYRSKGRRTRIMVTLASRAATDYEHVYDLVDAGMNTARINCAHDGPEMWRDMIENVRTAAASLGRRVKICMDLAGPKIRTGRMVAGPQVVSFQPDRDTMGRVSGPGLVWLAGSDAQEPPEDAVHLPVSTDWLSRVKVGDTIVFRDTRKKERAIDVVEEHGEGFYCHAFDRSFVETGTTLYRNNWDGSSANLFELPGTNEKIVLRVGDRLILHRSSEPGERSKLDKRGAVLSPAHVSCTSHEVFESVREGDRVLFDDGKIEGVVVESVAGESLTVEVTYAKADGQKLGPDKGINFPGTQLAIAGLTHKDKEDLRFVVKYADVVNMSFVNSAADVNDLLAELTEMDAIDQVGVILKIETQAAFDNLTDILLAAMKMKSVGVMIARGDLAVECGWEQMARVQQEIQALCRAAHLPDVWATQVLEKLAKKGLPSRAEITDAAAALSAECVMLNKGPYILDAVRLLDRILKDMRAFKHDKLPMLPPMDSASPVRA